MPDLDQPAPQLHLRAGSTAAEPLVVAVTPESAGWRETSLWVLELGAYEGISLESENDEIIVLPLSGAATVIVGGESFALAGRESVFDGPTDFVYVGTASAFSVETATGGRFALCGARATTALPSRRVDAADVAIETRGMGACAREVRAFAMPERFEADSLIACEVVTPGGNWSSYPSHKHDEDTATETQLEEIYYFEIEQSPSGTPGFGFQQVYGASDVLAEVRSGDVVLVPNGYHGPSVAAPGYDMYYLNVMAGSGPDRAWKTTDDPAHAWIRDTWTADPAAKSSVRLEKR